MSPSLSTRLFTHAAALVAAVTVTAVIVDVIAEIGHPPPNGFTVLDMLTPPDSWMQAAGLAPAVAPGALGGAHDVHAQASAER